MKKKLFKILISVVLGCCCALLPFADNAVLFYQSAEANGVLIVTAAEEDDDASNGEDLQGPESADSVMSGLDDGFGETGLFPGEEDDGFLLALLILGVMVVAVCISFVCSKIRQLKERKRKRYRYSSERVKNVKIAASANVGNGSAAGQTSAQTEGKTAQTALPARKRRYESLHAKIEEKNALNQENCGQSPE